MLATSLCRLCNGLASAFAAVSCFQSVVGKASFVPWNVIQYNLLPINKLLITEFGIEKIYIYKDLGKTPFPPLSWSPTPLPQATLSPFGKARGGLGDWGQCVVVPFLLLLFVP